MQKKEELGKEMVDQCAGLPLAIVVLGGILVTKNSVHEWEMAFENVKSYLKRGEGQGQLSIEDVLALSYNDLPSYLRPCFLYLSQFPEDYEIPVERLIQLWIAEGFVSSKDETMEDVAERWFIQLVERCMVHVGKISPTLRIETCRMHDLMRDVCLSMATNENFAWIIDGGAPSFSLTIGGGCAIRRIASHRSIPIQCIKSCALRSMLCFHEMLDPDILAEAFLNPKMLNYYEEHKDDRGACASSLMRALEFFLDWKTRRSWTNLINNFKLLRVMDFNEDYGGKLLNGIGDLIHLRFLNLSHYNSEGNRIPSSLANLRCLQTLDLRVRRWSYLVFFVPDVIWKLEQLRHLYLPKKFYLHDENKLKLHTLRNLLTLINFNTKKCSVGDLSKLTNLRKLKIYGPFSYLEEYLDQNLPIIASKCLRSLSIHISTPELLCT